MLNELSHPPSDTLPIYQISTGYRYPNFLRGAEEDKSPQQKTVLHQETISQRFLGRDTYRVIAVHEIKGNCMDVGDRSGFFNEQSALISKKLPLI